MHMHFYVFLLLILETKRHLEVAFLQQWSKMFSLKLQVMINRILPSIKKNQIKLGTLPLEGNRMYKLVTYIKLVFSNL